MMMMMVVVVVVVVVMECGKERKHWIKGTEKKGQL